MPALMPQSRICTKCGVRQPLTEFYLAARGMYGRAAQCKSCKAQYHVSRRVLTTPQEIRSRFEERALRRLASPKTCKRCGESKPRSEFRVVAQRKYGPVHDSECLECRKAGPRVLCACGCGEPVTADTKLKRERRYLSGHNSRVSHPMAGKGRHNMEGTPTYSSWSGMLDRCCNPNNRHWHRYGGRGIRVCAEWFDFAVFLKDMGVRPAGMTIERVDNDGNYEPTNCQWATYTTQARNRSNTKLTRADVHLIRSAPLSVPNRDLAAQLNVSTSTIYDIRTGRRWADV